ncbi:DUF3426 domain-containing protein [Candidatus Marithrix sp. Canyon 246]|uniref:DUF3426 domain-containing protein n=1 Tax=Candidatus Marithrix sp. Canyon 246 TaxID=1827136 RepID=UPI000849F25C|nr:DUF3426 domain-containing protein [Candidatus Marithrix sp. Canyon 246]
MKTDNTWKSFLFWTFIVIVFSVTLTIQAMWFWQRDVFLQNSHIRPLLVKFCYTFLCTLPPTRDLSSFQMKNYVFHVNEKTSLQLEAIFINKASFPQAYPDLQVTFIDINDHTIIKKRFTPVEYLQAAPDKMRAGASVHVKLDFMDMEKVIEDNKVAEGYRFKFL